jgi:hypothetical protein
VYDFTAVDELSWMISGQRGRKSPEYLAAQFAKRPFAAACDCRSNHDL